MRERLVVGFFTGLLLFGMVGISSATTIPIGNASFENDFVTDGNWVPSITDWDNTTPGPTAGNNATGTWNPPTIRYNNIPDGVNVAFTWGPEITQTLGTVVEADTDYTLSAFVGWRKGFDMGSNFLIELYGLDSSSDETVFESIKSASFTQGEFTQVSLTWSSSSAEIGQTLGIRLAKNSADGYADFDLISLNSVSNPVPEPATMLLFGLGLLGVAGVSRRKNNAGR